MQPINSKHINSFISQNSTIHDSNCNIVAVYCLFTWLSGFCEMVFRNGYEYRTATRSRARYACHITSFKQINALGGWSFFLHFLCSTRWRKTKWRKTEFTIPFLYKFCVLEMLLFGLACHWMRLGKGELRALLKPALGFWVESNDAIDEHRFGSAWMAFINDNQHIENCVLLQWSFAKKKQKKKLIKSRRHGEKPKGAKCDSI